MTLLLEGNLKIDGSSSIDVDLDNMTGICSSVIVAQLS